MTVETSLGTISGVLIDIDDTLVDTRNAFRHALEGVAAIHLPAADAGDLLTFWREDRSGWYRAHTRGELTHAEQRMLRVNEMHAAFGGTPLDDAGYAEWAVEWDRLFEEGWQPHEDSVRLLDALDDAAVPFGALSNAHVDHQVSKLRATGLSRVPMLVGLDTLGIGKPAPEVFEEGAMRLGVPIEECVYIGDEPDLDAMAAARAGMAGIWLDRPDARRQHEWAPWDGARLERVETLDEAIDVLLG